MRRKSHLTGSLFLVLSDVDANGSCAIAIDGVGATPRGINRGVRLGVAIVIYHGRIYLFACCDG